MVSLENIDEHFILEPNPIEERFKFHQRDQAPGEGISDYVSELRRLSNTCKFFDLDDRLRDRLVSAVRDEALRNLLFKEGPTLTLNKAVEMCIDSESARNSLQEVYNSSLQKLKHGNDQIKKKFSLQNENTSGKPATITCKNPCFRCGDMHYHLICKFKNTKCRLCSKVGHIEKVCPMNMKCILCSKVGHIEETCPMKCRLCSKVGHIVKECPMNTNVVLSSSKPTKSNPKKHSVAVSKRPCFRCGDMHYHLLCKFKNTKCRVCSTVGHIDRVCIMKKPKV